MEFKKEKADRFLEYWSAFHKMLTENEKLFSLISDESEYNLILSFDSKYNYELSFSLDNKTLTKVVYEKDSFKKFKNKGALSIKQIVSKEDINPVRKVKRTFNVDNWDDAFLILFQQLVYHPTIKEPINIETLNLKFKRKAIGEKWEVIEKF